MKNVDPDKISEKLIESWKADTRADDFPLDIDNIDEIKPYNPIIHDDTLLVPNKELEQYEFTDLKNKSMDLIFEKYKDILLEESKKQAGILRERHRDIEPRLEVPKIKIKDSIEDGPLVAPMDCHSSGVINVSPHVVEFINLDGSFEEPDNDEIFHNLRIDDSLRHELAHMLHFEIMAKEDKKIENPFAREALPTYEGFKNGHTSPQQIVNKPWLVPYLWRDLIEFDEENGYEINREIPHKYALRLALLTEESIKGTGDPELYTRRKLRTLGTDDEVEKLNNNTLLMLGRPNYMKTLEAAYNTLKGKNRKEAEEVLKDYEPHIERIRDNINGLQSYYYAIALHQTYENLFGPSAVAKDLERKANVRQNKIEFGKL